MPSRSSIAFTPRSTNSRRWPSWRPSEQAGRGAHPRRGRGRPAGASPTATIRPPSSSLEALEPASNALVARGARRTARRLARDRGGAAHRQGASRAAPTPAGRARRRRGPRFRTSARRGGPDCSRRFARPTATRPKCRTSPSVCAARRPRPALKAELDGILRDFDAPLGAERSCRERRRSPERRGESGPRRPAGRTPRASGSTSRQAALAAREAAEARQREAEQTARRGRRASREGDLAGAADLLKLAAGLAPQHPRVDEISARLREATERRAAAEEAAERLAQQIADADRRARRSDFSPPATRRANWSLARGTSIEALTLDPENAGAPSLQDGDRGRRSRRIAKPRE